MTLTRIVLGTLALAALVAGGFGASGAAFTAGTQNPGNAISAAPDWTGPEVTLANPGTPVRGAVALTASATDSRSSVASVSFQRRAANGSQWQEIALDGGSPWEATWQTGQGADGGYDLRAIATDTEGNTTTSAIVSGVLVDNTAPTGALADPGSPLTGTVGLDVSADDAGSGVSRVVVEYSPAGAGNWTEIDADNQAPWRVDWNTSALADAAYDLRAVVTDTAGNSTTSATVANRQVDNTTITLADPGAYLRGTESFSATATASGGVQRVEFQARPAGTTAWTTLASDSSSPYTATYDTTTAGDGTYELRAVMFLTGGSNEASAVRTAVVDNTAPTGTGVQGAAAATLGRMGSGDALTLAWSEKMDATSLFSGWDGAAPTTVYARLVDGGTKGTGGNQDWLEFFRNSGGTLTTGLGAVNAGGNFIDSGSTVVFTSSLALNAAGTTATITLGAASGGTSGLNNVGGNTTLRWTPAAAAQDLAGNAATTAQVTESGGGDRDF